MKKTKKIIVISVLCVMVSSVTALAGRGKTGDNNAIGTITQLKVQNPFATVIGITKKGKLWLAYTVYWNDGTEMDYKPIRVNKKFHKRIVWSALHPEGLDKVIVSLWRYKITSKRCAKDNGKACQYCNKNGFHMEDRRDAKIGS